MFLVFNTVGASRAINHSLEGGTQLIRHPEFAATENHHILQYYKAR
jgi:hypothetical protein